MTTKVTENLINSGSASDGDVLTADGSGGSAFEAPAAGGGGIPNGGYKTDHYYGVYGVSSSGTEAVTSGQLYGQVFVVGGEETFTRIGIEVTTGAAGNARLGIYNFADGVPTTLVLDAGTVSTSSTGEQEITISETLSAGVYALCAIFDATPSIVGAAASLQMVRYFYGDDTVAGDIVGVYETRAYGVLPATFSLSGNLGAADDIYIWLRKV